MNDYVQIIQDLQNKNQKNKEELIRLEEKQKNLKEEKDKILTQLSELNITEEGLQTKIEVLEEELQTKIEKIEKELE